MAYLYRHTRLDKNQPFYIGVGGLTTHDQYRRAYTKAQRSQLWNNITNKTVYEVEILLDNLSVEEVFKKEIEFINLYGRRNTNSGCLVNLTNGGEGSPGTVMSHENKKKASERGKKQIMSEHTKQALIKSRKGISHTKETIDKIKKTLSEKNSGEGNPFFGKKQSKEVIDIHSKVVLNLETGIFYDNAKEACNTISMNYSTFRAMLNGTNSNRTNFIYVTNRKYGK